MHVLILGAGRMAYGLVYDFLTHGDVDRLTVVDQSQDALQKMQDHFGNKRLNVRRASASDNDAMRSLMEDADGAVSAVPYEYNVALTELAIDTRTHLVDLGGNNDVVEQQFRLHKQVKAAGVGVIPDCGLAPGMASVLAAGLISELARVDALRIRVGGLPVNPHPPLNYMLVFSVHGLINEYVEPAVILDGGRIKTVPSMTDVEELEFPRPFGMMEAFFTSGGASTLPQTFKDRVDYLDYKTIRYPGHCHIVKAMLDMGFAGDDTMEVDDNRVNKRAAFEAMLEQALTIDDDDAVLLRITADGHKGGDRKRLQYQTIQYGDQTAGLTAMMRMTAFPAAILLQMLLSGAINEHGVLRQESSVPSVPFREALEKRDIGLEREGF